MREDHGTEIENIPFSQPFFCGMIPNSCTSHKQKRESRRENNGDDKKEFEYKRE